MPATSTARHCANQQNAQLSTGPKTPEGKARSRMNSLKHGLCARVVPLPNENPEEVANRERAFAEHYQPQNPRDAFLVHLAALSTIQFDRCHRFETAEVSHQIRSVFMEKETTRDEAVERGRMAIKTEGEIAIHGLRRIAMGCFYLIHEWTCLRGTLLRNGYWTHAEWERARQLDDEFPKEARYLVGEQNPNSCAEARARVLGRIEALLSELVDREQAWRDIEDAERAQISERALMIADAGLAMRVLRYRNAALSTFFRSTNELEKGLKERNELGAPNEPNGVEETPEVPDEKPTCDDPPAPKAAAKEESPPPSPPSLDERIASLKLIYHCDSNIATRSYTQNTQFNATPIRSR